MSWITLTATLVQNRLTKPELSAFTTAAKQDAQTGDQILADAITAITAQVRGYVGSCSRNTLGADGTIPDELEASALALIRRHLATRLPNMRQLFDELRQTETKDAISLLRDVAACRFKIVPPITEAPGNEQAGVGDVELTTSTTRRATRDTLEGL